MVLEIAAAVSYRETHHSSALYIGYVLREIMNQTFARSCKGKEYAVF